LEAFARGRVQHGGVQIEFGKKNICLCIVGVTNLNIGHLIRVAAEVVGIGCGLVPHRGVTIGEQLESVHLGCG